MIQITFQAAFDPFHTIFRFLRLLSLVKGVEDLTFEQVRILDFYFLFPFRVEEIRLSAAHRKFKKLSSTAVYLKPYGDLPNSFVLFGRMESVQAAALDTLVDNGYLDRGAFSVGRVRVVGEVSDVELAARINELNSAQLDVVEFIKVLASEYSVSGRDGLKSRTGLLEYRYDTV